MRLNPNIDLQNEVPGHNLVFLFKDLTFQDSAIDGFHRLFVSIFGYPFPDTQFLGAGACQKAAERTKQTSGFCTD